MDDGERVIYVGTFSKVLFPALRLGYLTIPEDLVGTFLNARLVLDHSSPLFDQLALTDFIEEGHFARHFRRMRIVYAERRAALVESAEQLLAGRLKISTRPAGLHAIAWINNDDDAPALSKELLQAGIEATPLSAYALHPMDKEGFVLGFGGTPPEEIWKAMRLMAKILN